MNSQYKALRILCLSLAMLMALCAMADGQDEKPKKAKLGEKAPDFTLPDTNEQNRSLSDYKDRIIILEWTDPECPFVDRHYRSKSMQETYKQVKRLDRKAIWLAINSTSNTNAQKMKFWIAQHKIQFPVLLDVDGKVARLYNARRTPHMFVIDRKGVLRYHGAIDDNDTGVKPKEKVANYVINAVKQILDDEPVSPDHTAPYGCSVKIRR